MLDAPPVELAQAHARLPADGAAEIAALRGRLEQVESELLKLDEDGIQVLCPFDAGFPPLLKDIPNPPAILSVRGRTESLHAEAVAIVGTRSPTPEGEAVAARLAGGLAQRGLCVISGLALGIDSAAHRGALGDGGVTVAVLGTGILRTWPPENRDLAEHVAESGALVSELPPRASVNVARLMARNRIQSGLARAVIVIETREEGGSVVTGSYARRQRRAVFAPDWSSDKPEAEGTKRLIAKGAIPFAPDCDVGALVQLIRASRADAAPVQPEQLRLI